MKIGLIGINMYPKYLNFACGLHTYAFQQFLLQQGIEATIIDYKPVYFDDFDMRHPADYYKKKYKKQKRKPARTQEQKEQKAIALQELKEKIDDWEPLYEEREIRYDKFMQFISKYYIKTEEQYDSDLLEIKDPGFDCYMCVTDVIWNLLPIHTYDRGFFLGSKAMEGKQKIAYAASRGVPKPYTQKEKELFFHYIEDIDAISVRENSLKDFIEENSEKTASLVLDPVMLHDKGFWQKLSVKPKEQGYILLYYVMEKAADTIKRAVEYAKKQDLLIIELSDRPVKGGRIKDTEVKHIARYDVSMEEWLGYIEYADCVFTNSFHGCCFSILFEKLFYVGRRKGDKVTNILETFGLNELRLPKKKGQEALFLQMPQEIDYGPVKEILKEKQRESRDFVLNAIKDAEQRILNHETKSREKYEAHHRKVTYTVNYQGRKLGAVHSYDTKQPGCRVGHLANGTLEYTNRDRQYKNDGTSLLEKNKYKLRGHKFIGWTIRIKIDTIWFWYMSDGTLVPKEELSEYRKKTQTEKMLLEDESAIPYLPVGRIRNMVAEANWKKKFFSFL